MSSADRAPVEVLHVSPLGFGPGGTWGGGERYALELARAQSEHVVTRLVVFGDQNRRWRSGHLSVHMLRRRGRLSGNVFTPVSELFPAELWRPRVVHFHHLETGLTAWGAPAAKALGARTFSTDLGAHSPLHMPAALAMRGLDGLLSLSEYAAGFHPAQATKTRVVYGGFDGRRFSPGDGRREDLVVYVGRLLPHKGIDILIRALPAGARLEIFGRPYDESYLSYLRQLAVGRDVVFRQDASDDKIAHAYRRARVAVLPSVTRTYDGAVHPKTELFGLVLVEAMASGTPVVATTAGAMPEVVVDGETGYVVPEGDPEAMGAALSRLLAEPRRWGELSANARAHVLENFTWQKVAERCFSAYEDLGGVSIAPRTI